MAVPEQTPFIEYTANGTTTVFPLPFQCDKAEYLIVNLDGNEAPVGSWSFVNGSVTFNTAPANGVVVNIERNTPFQRTTDYQSYNNSFRPAPVNKDFDLIWWKLQELGYRDQVIWLALVKEIADRIAGDANLQNQINTIDEWLDNLQQNVNENTNDIAQLVTDLSKEIADRIANDEALKEMFLAMMDEAINEGTINALAITHLDSLEALEGVTNVWDGRTIYVKDLGNYRYDALTTSWVKAYQDANNVKDGTEDQKQINDKTIQQVESINDLIKIKPRKDGQVVYVKSYHKGLNQGGGTFVYNAARSSENDDGVCINGWVRALDGYVTPEMFGATLEGDNYLPVQKAINFYNRGMGEVRLNRFYDISKGILIPPRLKVVGIGKDSCGFKKYTHDYLPIGERQWQTHLNNFDQDYIIAIDIDVDPNGDLSGDQIRSTTLQDFSCIGTAVGYNQYGCYTFETYHFVMRNIEFKNVVDGVRAEGWLWTLDNVSVRHCERGFVWPNGGTSFQCNNLYVKHASVAAYDMTNITYSTFTTCCSDFCTEFTYKLRGVNGVAFVGCGSEESGTWLFYIQYSKVSFTSFRAMNNPWGSNFIGSIWIQESDVTFNNLYGSFFEITGNSPQKPFAINQAIITMINCEYPKGYNEITDNDMFDIGGLSKINIIDKKGFSTIIGQAGIKHRGYMLNDVFTIDSEWNPGLVDSFLPEGTLWKNQKSNNDSTPYEWKLIDGNWEIISRTAGSRGERGFNPFVVPANSSIVHEIPLEKAKMGDAITASINLYLPSLTITAQVKEDGIAAVKLTNSSAASVNVGGCTIFVAKV
ncbi:hypothetical protein [Acinetobacter nosocomialis]|uniref:hypothetical protein n=1 Tax=Acinetobacter nosocomialis TaxID=106654 RepID=UPI0024B70D4B|nr:hypothetical protein [Acinetobacter nosocomialis]MDI9659385.1 hypothetical protein [Acinetobacter nosocomialis]